MRLTDKLDVSCVARDDARSAKGVLQGKSTNARTYKYVIDRRMKRTALSYAAVTVVRVGGVGCEKCICFV